MGHLVALMIALLVPAAAMAKAGCAEDREKFCKEVIEAKGKVGACLNEHKAELSEACKAKLDAKAKDKEAKEGKERRGFSQEGRRRRYSYWAEARLPARERYQ